MTNDEFRAWLQRVGLNRRTAAAALGISLRTLEGYLRDSCPRKIPQPIALLARHVEASLPQPLSDRRDDAQDAEDDREPADRLKR